MYNEEMKESMKKVAAHREANAVLEPRRMTADEKDKLLATYHPDYKQSEFTTLSIGPNKGEKVPLELAALLQAHSRIKNKKSTSTRLTMMLMFLLSAAAEQVHPQQSRLTITAQAP